MSEETKKESTEKETSQEENKIVITIEALPNKTTINYNIEGREELVSQILGNAKKMMDEELLFKKFMHKINEQIQNSSKIITPDMKMPDNLKV